MKDYTYPVDYTLFSIKEIEQIVAFMALIEEANEGAKIADLDKKYNEYRKVINSTQIERQMEREFESLSGYSISKTIKRWQDGNK